MPENSDDVQAFWWEGYYFTKHAATAMRASDRNATREDVRNVLRHQDRGEEAGTHDLEGTLVLMGYDLTGWELDVVVEETDRAHIVSVVRPKDPPRLPRPRFGRRSGRRQR